MDNIALETSAQHIKDFKLAIEFKYLMKHSPAGVYLMPEFDNIRKLHGVIFLRRGLYRDGIFRFQIHLPSEYNDVNTHPEIFFNPPVFNPMVDPVTGRLDLKIDEMLKEWQPEKHFIVTAITFLKKIFYMKSYDTYAPGSLPNEEARQLFDTDKDAFLQRVTQAVEESGRRVYDKQPESCSIVFTEPKPAHEDIIKEILSGLKDLSTSESEGLNHSSSSPHLNESAAADVSALVDEDDDMLGSGSGKKSREADLE